VNFDMCNAISKAKRLLIRDISNRRRDKAPEGYPLKSVYTIYTSGTNRRPKVSDLFSALEHFVARKPVPSGRHAG